MDRFPAMLHPAHLAYLKHIRPYTLGDLFAELDKLAPAKRKACLRWTLVCLGAVEYERLGNECASMLKHSTFPEEVLAYYITGITLNALLADGDVTLMPGTMSRARAGMHVILDTAGQTASRTTVHSPDCSTSSGMSIGVLPNQAQEAYERYVYFCENVLAGLLQNHY